MDAKSSGELLHVGNLQGRELYCRFISGPETLELTRNCSLIHLREGGTFYIPGRKQIKDIPPPTSSDQWIIVNERPVAVQFGFSALGQCIRDEVPGTCLDFGFSGTLQFRFFHSPGLLALTRLAPTTVEQLTGNDAMLLLRPLLLATVQDWLSGLMPSRPWPYQLLMQKKQDLTDALYDCFQPIFDRYGILMINGSQRITAYVPSN